MEVDLSKHPSLSLLSETFVAFCLPHDVLATIFGFQVEVCPLPVQPTNIFVGSWEKVNADSGRATRLSVDQTFGAYNKNGMQL